MTFFLGRGATGPPLFFNLNNRTMDKKEEIIKLFIKRYEIDSDGVEYVRLNPYQVVELANEILQSLEQSKEQETQEKAGYCELCNDKFIISRHYPLNVICSNCSNSLRFNQTQIK
jgi:hypothetical protein